jgi:pimeloyl-ACP methyl ester carboxylesterase
MNPSARSIRLLFALATIAVSGTAVAQSWGPRTLAELKEETLDRARGGWRGVKFEDAARAVAALDSLDRDVWAAAWSEIGEEYLARAAAAASPNEARENYYYAWRYFNTARWPTEKHSPGKRRAYESGLRAFELYGRHLDPPLETVRIPFEDTELVAYLRIPAAVRPAPLVFGINGLDSRKEDVIAGADAYLDMGIAAFAIDMPGTGQAPILIDVGAERMFSAALDYLQTRPDIDASRIVVYGRSWSGYWAAVLAYTERDRIRGAVIPSVGIHRYFQPEWQREAVNAPEYLFDLFPARAAVYGVETMEEFLAFGPRMSLIARGLIDQPSAPMLLVNGALDTQMPISDLYLLMRHGDPKLAWVNPEGGHGGDSERYPSRWVREQVIYPWLRHQLGVP